MIGEKMKNTKRIGDMLLEKGLINEEQLAEAISIQKVTKQRLYP